MSKRVYTSIPEEINEFLTEYVEFAKTRINSPKVNWKGKDSFVVAQIKWWLQNPAYFEYYLSEAEKVRLSGFPASKQTSISIDDDLFDALQKTPEPVSATLRNFYFAMYAYFRAMYN
jgi:hypothetical protein